MTFIICKIDLYQKQKPSPRFGNGYVYKQSTIQIKIFLIQNPCLQFTENFNRFRKQDIVFKVYMLMQIQFKCL